MTMNTRHSVHQQLHASATHEQGWDANCPICNPSITDPRHAVNRAIDKALEQRDRVTPSFHQPATVEVVTDHYEFVHGHRPRGYGSWAFGPQKNTRLEDMAWFNGMMYGEAKRAAIKWAREHGFDAIYPQT